MRRGRSEPTEIILRSGKKIKRVIRTNDNYWRSFVIYNGRKIGVEYRCGDYYEVYN